ncbi:hypothetical protein [Synechococcus sp. CC9311]|uniref:hypothetical protein n=1 Tax=Synechococcus sp. (strain CC9311) TaxID=64471 RepID=UPI0000DDB344|nr:hypothetical protein [Synechococcus sp. CC9311]ABI45172.1 hypothetical protein sync_2674 [Synechococcus sp. CC9311]
MPSHEAGFYQLTALLPIKSGLYTSLPCQENVSGPCDGTQSYAHHLKAYLNQLSDSFLKNIDPQLSELYKLHLFDHTRCTHFARFVVVDQLFYNGRRRNDSLIDFFRVLLGNKDLLSKKDRIDKLESPYLLIAIDFDCHPSSTSCVQDYLSELWPYASYELTKIFHHCEGFSLPSPPQNQKTLESYPQYWHAYHTVERLLLSHEVETTYPFSAYFWVADKVQRWNPSTDQVSPSEFKNRWALIIIGILPFILVVMALLMLAICLGSLFLNLLYDTALSQVNLSDVYQALNQWWLIGFGGLSVASLVLFMFAWRYFIKSANMPLPQIDGVDLKSIAKSLYLQGKLLEMYGDWQESDRFDKGRIRQRFSSFLDDHKPSDIHSPSLQPGKYFSIR